MYNHGFEIHVLTRVSNHLGGKPFTAVRGPDPLFFLYKYGNTPLEMGIGLSFISAYYYTVKVDTQKLNYCIPKNPYIVKNQQTEENVAYF